MTDDFMKNKWIFEDCGVCLTRSFDKLPDHIIELINKSYNIKYHKYCNDVDIIQNGTYFERRHDVIFTCSSYYSSAIILDNRQYHPQSTMNSLVLNIFVSQFHGMFHYCHSNQKQKFLGFNGILVN